jgi:hypothetical protein
VSRPYWSQRGLFSAFDKHHIAVFSINYSPNDRLFVKILKDLQTQLRYEITGFRCICFTYSKLFLCNCRSGWFSCSFFCCAYDRFEIVLFSLNLSAKITQCRSLIFDFFRNVRESYFDLVDNLLTLCQLVLDRKTKVCKDAATHCKSALLLLKQEVRIRERRQCVRMPQHIAKVRFSCSSRR